MTGFCNRRRPLNRMRLGFVTSCLLLMTLQDGHADVLLKSDWHLLQSEHFSLLSDTDVSTATDLLKDLEQFRSVVLLVTGLGEVEEPISTRAIVFAKPKHFYRIARSSNIVGYMRPSLRGTRMVTSGDSLSMDQRVVMFHEYIHHLVRIASSQPYPKWYDEGLADTLATIYEANGRIVIGATSEGRINNLSRNSYSVGLSRIVNEDNLYQLHPYVVSYFYSASWALVNYLHISHLAGGENRLSQLQRYLQMIAQNRPRAEAFEAAFETTPKKLEREMFKFLRKRQRPVLSLPADRFEYKGAIKVATAEPDLVALELAFQAFYYKPKVAHSVLDAALKTHPDNLHLRSAKGIAYQMQKKYDAALPLLSAAYEADPTDPVLAIDLADFLVIQADADCPEDRSGCEGTYIRARELYAEALAHSPDNPEIKFNLGKLLLIRFEQYTRALELLGEVLEVQPWNSNLHLLIGLSHKGRSSGQDPARDAAVDHLTTALYWAHNDTIRQRAGDALTELGVNTTSTMGDKKAD